MANGYSYLFAKTLIKRETITAAATTIKPVKITVKGQTVFLCCAGCEESIKKDPDKYLAKLKASGAK